MRFRQAAILTVAICASSSPGFAWDAEGHRIIAQIAADELTPEAKQQVQSLLGGDAAISMTEASTWADEIRRTRPDTARWHFVDIPVGSRGYDYARDCRNQNCVVAQIDRAETYHCGSHVFAPGRAEALRFLIHFVGDIHQPLRSGQPRQGRKWRIRVVLEGSAFQSAHSVWDVDAVRFLGRSPEEVAVRLEREITPADMRAWQTGNARTGRMNRWNCEPGDLRELRRGRRGARLISSRPITRERILSRAKSARKGRSSACLGSQCSVLRVCPETSCWIA